MPDSDQSMLGPTQKLTKDAFIGLRHRLLNRLYETYQITPDDQKDLETAILEVIADCLFRKSTTSTIGSS